MRLLTSLAIITLLFSTAVTAKPLQATHSLKGKEANTCLNQNYYFKFRNEHQGVSSGIYAMSDKMNVHSTLPNYPQTLTLPSGDSKNYQITFQDDKAFVLGTAYSVKQGKTRQVCEVASECHCELGICVPYLLTNGAQCYLTADEPDEEQGTESNPYIVVIH